MFEHILDCPKCQKRFHCETDGEGYPEFLTCPECGEISPAGEYTALLLCRECRSKLKVPLSILHEEGNICPKCGTEITVERLDTVDREAPTLADAVISRKQKRMLRDGEFFDKFRIIRLLGRGGMAEVYLAEHLLLKQTCALKIMQKTLDQEGDPVFVKRFIREAKLTHSLSHPNIVKVFDAGSDFKTGYLFLAMEYVEGKTLHDLIYDRELSEADLLEILRIMTAALKTLEEAKIVHRDIKPSNIMYTVDGVYKLMDLGIAKMESNHQAGDMTLTMEQSTIGTPGYASPEQCRSAHQTDIRSDIFSLGATLYHAATGIIPFSGETPVATILNMMQNDPEPVRNFRSDLSEGFIELLEKMMKKKPSERFQNISELQEAIEKAEQEKSAAPPVRKLKKAVAALTTAFFVRKSSQDSGKVEKKPSFKFKLAMLFCNFLFACFLVIFAAANIYYVYTNLNHETVGYKEFMTKLLTLKKSEKKFHPGEMESPSVRLQKFHPLVQDPDKKLLPAEGRQNGIWTSRYPLVNVDFGNYHGYTFDKMPQHSSNIPSGAVRDGMLRLTGDEKKICLIKVPYRQFQKCSALFMNFKLHSNKSAALVTFSGIEMFVLHGTLHIVYGMQYYVDTRIRIPANRWVTLGFVRNINERRISILSGNRLLGSYLYPQKHGMIFAYCMFRSHFLRENMKGDVDFLALSYDASPTVLIRSARKEPFQTSENRLPDKLIFHSGRSSEKFQRAPGRRVVRTVPPENSSVRSLPEKKPLSPGNVLPAQRRSGSLFPLWCPDINRFLPAEGQSVDEHLASLKQEYAKYAAAVKKLQASLKDIPSSVPAGIRQKRHRIANTAAELCQMWEKRLVYLEKRNKKINAVRQKQYNPAVGAKIRHEIQQHTQRRRDWGYNRADIRFAEQLVKWLSNEKVDPNLEITDGTYRQYSGPVIRLVSSGRLQRQKELFELLIRRHADPGPVRTVYPRVQKLLVNYGMRGKVLNTCFNGYFFKTQLPQGAFGELATMFSDGAHPRGISIFRAVQHGNYDLLLFLLACGADPNAVNDRGETPLFITYRRPGSQNFRELLLAGGADPEIVSRSGRKAADLARKEAFYASWEKGDFSAVKKALESREISPDALLYDDSTLLTSACRKGDKALVQLLLEQGADVHKSDLKRCLPIGAACIRKRNILPGESEDRGSILLMLLAKGAKLSSPPHPGNRSNATILSYALSLPSKNRLVPRMLPYVDQILHFQWSRIFHTMMPRSGSGVMLSDANKQLLLDRCPPGVLRQNVYTLTLSRLLTGPLLEKMFRAGLDPNLKMKRSVLEGGRRRLRDTSLLHYFLQQKMPADVIEAALKAGADPHWKDHQGRSLEELTQDPQIRELLRTYKRRI